MSVRIARWPLCMSCLQNRSRNQGRESSRSWRSAQWSSGGSGPYWRKLGSNALQSRTTGWARFWGRAWQAESGSRCGKKMQRRQNGSYVSCCNHRGVRLQLEVGNASLTPAPPMSSPDNYPWSVHLIWKLLHNDSGALSLLANNPFPDRPPRFIRARLFRYTFAPLGSDSWWERSELGTWLPPVSVENSNLQRFLRSYGWLTDRLPSGPI